MAILKTFSLHVMERYFIIHNEISLLCGKLTWWDPRSKSAAGNTHLLFIFYVKPMYWFGNAELMCGTLQTSKMDLSDILCINYMGHCCTAVFEKNKFHITSMKSDQNKVQVWILLHSEISENRGINMSNIQT